MKIVNLVTLCLLIIGGLNWGLVGLFNFDVVAAIFGATFLTNLIYVLVGLSALWQIYPFTRATQIDEPFAEATSRPGRH